MTNVKKMIAVAVTTLFFTACRKDMKVAETTADTTTADAPLETTLTKGGEEKNDSHGGYVYTLGNQSNGNKVMAYRRDENGKLEFVRSYATGGNGTGSGLASQGSVTLTDNNLLLAVNAGSNSISSFKVSHNELYLISTVSSKGEKPVSITQHDKLVYVLNAGGNGNISGFSINSSGKLSPIPHSTLPLSSNAADPAQISFVNDGANLVVTEKAVNKIITYTMNHFGVPTIIHSLTSANPTPFGFAVGDHGKIFVSEAAGGAVGLSSVSAYRVDYNGSITLINGPVSAGQTAACWVVLTENGKYVYATNTGSNTVSSFTTGFSGRISILQGAAGNSGATPIDAALSDQSKFLYTVNADGHSISAFRVNNNGSLNSIQTITGLPIGSSGLAAE